MRDMSLQNDLEEKPFQIRVYKKRELAQMYFPGSNPKSATVSLQRWINRCTELHAALISAEAYNKNRNYFLSYEVELIVRYLGEP